jgi:hypothetical protein
MYSNSGNRAEANSQLVDDHPAAQTLRGFRCMTFFSGAKALKMIK